MVPPAPVPFESSAPVSTLRSFDPRDPQITPLLLVEERGPKGLQGHIVWQLEILAQIWVFVVPQHRVE